MFEVHVVPASEHFLTDLSDAWEVVTCSVFGAVQKSVLYRFSVYLDIENRVAKRGRPPPAQRWPSLIVFQKTSQYKNVPI